MTLKLSHPEESVETSPMDAQQNEGVVLLKGRGYDWFKCSPLWLKHKTMIGPSVYSQMMKAGCLDCDVAVLNQGTTGGKIRGGEVRLHFLL